MSENKKVELSCDSALVEIFFKFQNPKTMILSLSASRPVECWVCLISESPKHMERRVMMIPIVGSVDDECEISYLRNPERRTSVFTAPPTRSRSDDPVHPSCQIPIPPLTQSQS